MTGLLGFILLIVSVVCGYHKTDYTVFIFLSSISGSMLYHIRSPVPLMVATQHSFSKFIFWITWVFFAQGITWSFFYWIGTFFS